jgi:hypothetical protein
MPPIIEPNGRPVMSDEAAKKAQAEAEQAYVQEAYMRLYFACVPAVAAQVLSDNIDAGDIELSADQTASIAKTADRIACAAMKRQGITINKPDL